MAKTGYTSVSDYITRQPKGVQPILRRVRGVIRKVLPAAEEVISYQIPAYKLPGGAVIYFAGWKEHYSLYPATAGVLQKFAEELAPYKVRKGTIRFPLSEPVPVKLIEGIVKMRAAETAKLAAAKPRKPASKKQP